jgi:hypothetical protein
LQKSIHQRTRASPARDRLPAGRGPSQIPCTHSFRTNGGYTDATIDRLSTPATRRIGASVRGRPVKRSGCRWPARPFDSLGDDLPGRKIKPMSMASPDHRGPCKHAPLTGLTVAAAYARPSSLVSKRQRDFSRFRYRPAAVVRPAAAARLLRRSTSRPARWPLPGSADREQKSATRTRVIAAVRTVPIDMLPPFCRSSVGLPGQGYRDCRD